MSCSVPSALVHTQDMGVTKPSWLLGVRKENVREKHQQVEEKQNLMLGKGREDREGQG